MKKGFILLLSILLACTCLWGCGGKQDNQAEDNNVVEEVAGEPNSEDENEETIEEDALEELIEKIEVQEETNQTQENEGENNQSVSVYNNGGNFLKIDNHVYYIKLTEDTINRTVLFGEFRKGKQGGSECALMCFDTETGESSELTTVMSDTRLAYYDGYIYTCDYSFDYEWELWRVNATTGEKELFQYAKLLYIDSETGRIVTIDSDEKGSNLRVFGGTNLIHTIFIEEDPDINVGVVCLKDAYLIYELQELVETDDGPEYLNKLCSVNIDSGEEHFLGVLPECEDLYSMMYGEVDQLAVLENKLYIAYGYYAGTGHFLNERHTCVANLDQDDSIEEVNNAKNGEVETNLFLVDCLPEIVFSDMQPYEVALNYDTYNLQLFLPNSDGKLVAKDLANIDGLKYDSENRKLAEVKEYVDGKVYLIIDEVEYNPEESIGWRDAYDVNVIHYYEMDVDTGNMIEIEPATEF